MIELLKLIIIIICIYGINIRYGYEIVFYII